MAGIELRRTDGRRSLRAQGSCGNLRLWELEYERAYAEQVLRTGGTMERLEDGSALVVDRQGRRSAVSAAVVAMLGEGLG